MKKRENNMRQKQPYSTPSLMPRSLSSLVNRTGNTTAASGRAVETSGKLGDQPPLVSVEGFEGQGSDLVQALCLLGWSPQAGTEPAVTTFVVSSYSGDLPCIAIVDLRSSRDSSLHQTLIRVERDSHASGTFTLLLTDSCEDFTAGSGSRRRTRWHFAGRITPGGLAVLVKSLVEIWAALIDTPSKAGSTSETAISKAPASASMERD